MRKGKVRLVPKKRKPSKLKIAIRAALAAKRAEREAMRVARRTVEQIVDSMFPPHAFSTVDEEGEDVVMTDTTSPPPTAGAPAVLSKKVRSYVTQMLSKELDAVVEQMLSDLIRFQQRKNAKKRYVTGIRETMQKVKAGLCKCVLMPPDLPFLEGEHGLNETVDSLITECGRRNVPVIFVFTLRRLTRVMHRPQNRVRISCVGLLRVDGAEEAYKHASEIAERERQRYRELRNPELAKRPITPS
jgi:ribosomal protein L7Ae-like RNA K-turn-binding protein